MILIAHRGNINGPDKENENNPKYLIAAIEKGFYVETDLWLIENDLYLGHDGPEYMIKIDFLLSIKDQLFCHCKNIRALHFIVSNYSEIECFFHDLDECTLTSKNRIWTSPGKELTQNSICVMPERTNTQARDCYGVCTDYILKYYNNE